LLALPHEVRLHFGVGMTLLFITSRYPYPTLKGDQVRAHHQIRALAKQGHEIILVTFDNGQRNPDFEKICKAVYLVKPPTRSEIMLQLGRLLFSQQPLQLAFFHSVAMTHAIEKAITTHQPNAAVLQLSRMGHYLSPLQQYHIPTLLDLIDSLAMNIDLKAKKAVFPMNLLWRLEAKRLHAYELKAVGAVATATAVSQKDKDFLAKDTIAVNPNGVAVSELSGQKREAATLLFHGNMSYYPNVEAAKFLVTNVMPLVWQHLPRCKVQLVGATPTKDVTDLASERVQVTGFVEDVKPFLSGATLGVYPIMRATGIQNKILEAMMQGLPVITTATVADGIQEGRAGEHFVQAESAADISRLILNLLANTSERERLATAGRALVQGHYTWEKTAGMLGDCLQAISK
jgi:polysaccharide biosynthesis protein PslH